MVTFLQGLHLANEIIVNLTWVAHGMVGQPMTRAEDRPRLQRPRRQPNEDIGELDHRARHLLCAAPFLRHVYIVTCHHVPGIHVYFIEEHGAKPLQRMTNKQELELVRSDNREIATPIFPKRYTFN